MAEKFPSRVMLKPEHHSSLQYRLLRVKVHDYIGIVIDCRGRRGVTPECAQYA
jgi:hypothetical protein